MCEQHIENIEEWDRMRFSELIGDIKFVKNRAWLTVYYTILMLAAIYKASTFLDTTSIRLYIFIPSLIMVATSILVIWDCHKSACNYRKMSLYIRGRHSSIFSGSENELPINYTKLSYDWRYALLFMFTIFFAFAMFSLLFFFT